MLDESRHSGWRKTRKTLTFNYWILAPWILSPVRGDYVDAPSDCIHEIRAHDMVVGQAAGTLH